MQISFWGFYVLTGRTEHPRLRDDVGIVPYAGCRMVWFDRAGEISGSRDMDIDPYAQKRKNPAGPIEVSRVKHTHYTARKNFTRNRAEMA